MINIKYLLCIFTCIALCSALSAQSNGGIAESKTEITYAKKLGVANPISNKRAAKNYDEKKHRLSRRDYRRPENFKSRSAQVIMSKDIEHLGPDKIRQSEIPISKNPPIQTLVNIEGLSNGSIPQDPTGDIGLNHYIQAINDTEIGVYSKQGELINSFNSNSLWNDVNIVPGGDPIILFDQEAKRWVITEFHSQSKNILLVAISQTSDPLGNFNLYSFNTPSFPDYPKYAIWSNAYSVTTQEVNFRDLHVYFINRDEMIAGAENVRILRTSVEGPNNPSQPFIVATPVDWSGAAPPPEDSHPMVLSLADASWTENQVDDLINVNTFDIDWDNETIITRLTTIPVSPYDSYACANTTGGRFACIPQQNGGGLDGLPELITYQPHYRNFGSHEAVVFNFITDVADGDNVAGLRWIELRRTAGEKWSLYQEGTFAPDDGLHRFMGGIAMDGEGNIGMAYNTSGENDFVSIRYTGRLADDPLGIMTLEEQLAVQGTGTIRSNSRFGDYSHITIDPIDNSTFWFTSEWAKDGAVSTQIIAFNLDIKNNDLAPTSIVQPQSSADLGSSEEVHVVIKNIGLSSASNYKIGYQLDNGPIVEDQINIELSPDATLEHTFSQPIDLSEVGQYKLNVFTSYDLDNATYNDTIYRTIEKKPRIDLGVFSINVPVPVICGDTTDLSYVLSNLGADSIMTAQIEIKVNGVSVDNFLYESGIGAGKRLELKTSISDLIEGPNIIEISATDPNGGVDELPNNNINTRTIEATTDGESVILELLTDYYPEETSWELLDDAGTVLYSSDGTLDGLEEQTLFSNFCLDLDQCYTFVIYDEMNDGVFAFLRPSGSYKIYDKTGKILASIINIDFGSEESNSFCLDSECNLEANLLIEDVMNNQDGMIIVEVTSGVGPIFEYSIDGGATFSFSNVFENLAVGEYEIIIKDSNDCIITLLAEVDVYSSNENINQKIEALISPNPTDGILEIELSGVDSDEVLLPIAVFDSEGKKIQQTTIANYSGVYKGMLSLYYYPAGLYFIKFDLGDSYHLQRVIKQ